MGPPSRSFPTGQAGGLKAHADAYDCIMVRIRIGSTEYKCVARGAAPDGKLPSDHQASGIRRRRLEKVRSLLIVPARAKQKEQALEPSSQLGNVTVVLGLDPRIDN